MGQRVEGSVEALLGRPRALAWVVVLGLLLAAPSLATGLVVDDHVHMKFVRLHLAGDADVRDQAPWDMFEVAGRKGVFDVTARIFLGILPWWTSPTLSMAFFRPLAVATHYLDYGLWPELPWLMHLHNLLWYAVLLVAAGVLYRRVMGHGWVATLAALMYAVDEAHAEGASWVASRNTLMTAVFVVLVLVAHDRARRDGWRPGRWLAPLALSAALLSSEGGTAAFAYLVPYAIFIDRAPLRARVLSLWPLVAVTGVWQVVYRALGYGIRGSGLYLDPARDPLHFLSALPGRLPAVLGDQLVVPTLLRDLLGPRWHGALDAFAWVAGAALLWVTLRALRGRPTLAFWLCGLLLSALPISAIGSTPRLLFITALGAFGLVAELAACASDALARRRGSSPQRDGARDQARDGARGSLLPVVTGLFLALHVPLAAALAPQAAVRLLSYEELMQDASDSFPWGDDLQDKNLYVLNTPNFFVTTFAWAYVRGAPPRSAHILGASMNAVEAIRIGPDMLDLAPQGGYLLEPWSTMVRRPDEPFTLGARVVVGEMTIEILQLTADGRPARIRCHLPDMGSSQNVWVYWNSETRRYERTELPALGQRLHIAAEPDPSMQLNAQDID